MPDRLRYMPMFPWSGGISQFGDPSVKPPSGLTKANNWTFSFDGTKHRREGQVYTHRTPIYEGRAFGDHFTLGDLSRWSTTTENDVSFTFTTASNVHAYGTTGTGASTIVKDLADGDIKYLVSTITDSTTETDSVTIAWRSRFADIPSDASTLGYFQLKVDPGQDGSSDTIWLLDMKFADNGIWFWNGLSYTEVSVMGEVTDVLGSTTSADYIDTEWHDWKIIISGDKTAGYTAGLYVHETLIYSGITIPTDSSATGAATLYFQLSAGGNDMDLYLDYFEVEAEVQEIRGVGEYLLFTTTLSQQGRVAIYAGSRIYVHQGDFYSLLCIDEGLEKNKIADFISYKGFLIYTTTGPMAPRKWKPGLLRGIELSGAPEANYLQVHANRLWLAGSSTNPSRIYWSGLLLEDTWHTGDPQGETFNDAGWIEIEPDDGQRITGVAPPFRDTLLIYKTRSIYRIDGRIPDTFSLNPVSRTLGCACHRSIKNVLNDQFFVSQYGVHSIATTIDYGDLEMAMISRDLRDFWNNNVNAHALENAWAVHNESLDRYEVMVPIPDDGDDGRTPNRLLCLHYSVRPEGFDNGIWSIKKIKGFAGAMVQQTGDLKPSFLVGSTTGFICRQDTKNRFDFPVFAT